MKKIILAIFSIVSIQACQESLPPIDFSVPAKVLIDSCYTLEEDSIPEGSKRGILIEDLTGVRCVACPNAAEAASAIKTKDKDSVVVIMGLYTTDPPSLTSPVDKEEQDLRTDVAQLIGTNIYNFSNILPGGGVNRTAPADGQPLNVGYSQWQSLANTFEGDTAIVNLDITKVDVNDSTLEVYGVFVFTDDAEARPFVSIFLLEDDIPHPQKTLSGTDEEYIHKHIVRKAYTPYNGNPLFGSDCGDAVRGAGLKKGWEITIPEYVNREKASLVFVVNYNDGNNKQVIQCKEVKLKK
jgi:hypothetical protein